MAFFVIERDQATGALRIPVPESFPTREAALEALAAAIRDGSAQVAGEVFVSDLGSAVPVLMMPTAPAAAAAAEEPAPETEEAGEPEEVAAEDAGDVESVEETVVYAAWADAVLDTEAEESNDSLADALKRAATSLEAEGIVAPESIDFEPEGEAEEGPETEAESEEPEAAEEPETAEEPESEFIIEEVEEAEEEAVVEDLPEAGAEEPEALEESAEPEAETSAEAEALTEIEESVEVEPAAAEEGMYSAAALDPGLEMSSMVAGAPSLGEEAYLPRPVIMGDYGDEAPDSEEVVGEAFVPSEPHDPASVLEYAELADADEAAAAPAEGVIPDSILDPFGALAASESEVASAVVEEAGDDGGLDAQLAGLADLPVIDASDGYEPAGELDLAQYTCDDCIYVNTCPKVGQATPADCGSFQWRAE